MARSPEAIARAKRRYRESHREELRQKGREYAARRRAEDPTYVQYIRDWHRHKYQSDPEAARAANRRRYAENLEASRERARRWKLKNPEKVAELNRTNRAIRAAAPIGDPFTRSEIYARDGGKCHICGRPCHPNRFEIDHLVPLARGGSECASNVAIAHKRCNRRRGAGFLPAQLRLIG